MTDGSNRRLIERCAVEARIEVFDQSTGKKLGDLVNVHAEGLMLAGDHTVSENNVYQVSVRPTGAAESIGDFELGVDCLWLREMSNEEGNWAGFRIISGSVEAIEKIHKIINLFGQ